MKKHFSLLNIQGLGLVGTMFLLGCSEKTGESVQLSVGEAVSVNVGDAQNIMIMRSEKGFSVVLFRHGVDELGVAVDDRKIEVQRKGVLNGQTFMTFADSVSLIPNMRVFLGEDGNIKTRQILTGWEFQEVDRADGHTAQSGKRVFKKIGDRWEATNE